MLLRLLHLDSIVFLQQLPAFLSQVLYQKHLKDHHDWQMTEVPVPAAVLIVLQQLVVVLVVLFSEDQKVFAHQFGHLHNDDSLHYANPLQELPCPLQEYFFQYHAQT